MAKSSTTINWHIKGIQKETRERVKKAAKRSGVTIGAYVDRVLSEAAANDLKGKSQPPVKMEDVQTQLSQITTAISDLTAKMDQNQKRSFWDLIKGK